MSFQFPVMLDVEGQPCLVIGGGAFALDKVRSLLAANARVAALAAELSPELAEMAAEGRIEWIERDYEPGDLEGRLVAIAATGDHVLNARIWEEAQARGTLFNAVDDPSHCRFTFPAVHRQGDLLVAVSSNGKSPAVASRLRDRIARELGPEYAELLELLGDLRQAIASRHPDFESRRRVWYKLIDSQALDLIREGGREPAEKLLRQLLDDLDRP